MSSAAGELFALLSLVFLVECARWVARGAVVVRVVPVLGRWVSAPIRVASQLTRALAIGWPLAPLGSMFAAERWPFVVGANGVRVVPPEAPLGARAEASDVFVAWSDAGRLQVAGKTLTLDGKVVATLGSQRAAAAVARLLERCREAKGERGRGRAVSSELQQRHDVEALRARLGPWRRWRWVAYVTHGALFVAIFGTGAVFSFSEWRPPVLWAAAAVFFAWWLAAVSTVVVVRRCLPPTFRPTKLQWVVTLLSPVSLVRALDLVESELCGDFDPEAHVVVLLKPQAARDALDGWRRMVAFPVRVTGGVAAEAAAESDDVAFRALRLEMLDAHIAGLKGTAAPKVEGLHCPRCLSPYARAVPECQACPGVALVG